MDVAFGYASSARLGGSPDEAFGAFERGEIVLAVVCDAGGATSGGQEAANLAIRTIADVVRDGAGDPGAVLVDALRLANRTLYDTGRVRPSASAMSTTVVAVIIQEDLAWVAHVGDSRAYLIRGGEALPLTRDHTMANMLVDNHLLTPEDATTHPESWLLARSLGKDRHVQVDLRGPMPLMEGDVMLLVSDGVHGALTEGDLSMGDWQHPSSAAHLLIQAATSSAEPADFATVVGVRLGSRGSAGMGPTRLPVVERPGDLLTPSSADLALAAELRGDLPLSRTATDGLPRSRTAVPIQRVVEPPPSPVRQVALAGLTVVLSVIAAFLFWRLVTT